MNREETVTMKDWTPITSWCASMIQTLDTNNIMNNYLSDLLDRMESDEWLPAKEGEPKASSGWCQVYTLHFFVKCVDLTPPVRLSEEITL